jgi:hypothetical protein
LAREGVWPGNYVKGLASNDGGWSAFSDGVSAYAMYYLALMKSPRVGPRDADESLDIPTRSLSWCWL